METSLLPMGMEPFADLKAEGLPGVLQEIAKQVSVEAAVLMALAFGGREIYLPSKSPPYHPLSKAVGHECAMKICAMIGAGHLRIPSAIHVLRYHEARHLRRQGKTLRQIAAIIGVGESRVGQLCRGVARGSARRICAGVSEGAAPCCNP